MAFSLTRRRLLGAAAAVPIAGLLAACGGGSSSTPAATTSSSGSGAPATTAAAIPTSPPAPQSSGGGTPSSAAGGAATPASSVASPAATSASGGQVKDVSFTVVDATEPASLDPCVGTGPYQHIINAMYDKLVRWTPEMQVEPRLALSWEVSTDHKSWTFKLRPNVKFHDGTPFTSAAVKTMIEHIIDPKTNSTRRASYTLVKEVQTPDDLTAVFVTDPITPDLPFLLADGSANISSPTAIQKYGPDYGRNPVGTGPFKFEEWVPNDHVSAVINPDYWGTKPLVRRFVYKPVTEPSTRVIVLKNGEGDVVFRLPPNDIAGLKTVSTLKLFDTPSILIINIQLKQTKPPFSDKRVRRAMNMAIDKNSIIKNILLGHALPLLTPDCPGLWGAFEFDPVPYDPNQAKQLLKDAGFGDGFNVTFCYTVGRFPGDEQVVQAVQGYWSQIGVKVTFEKTDESGFVAALTKDPDQFPTLVTMVDRASYYTAYHLHRMYQSDATKAQAAQRSGYSNPEVDKLLAQVETTFEPDQRLPLFKQVEQIIWDDQPLVFMFREVNLYGQQTNVSGFTVIPSGDLIPGALTKG